MELRRFKSGQPIWLLFIRLEKSGPDEWLMGSYVSEKWALRVKAQYEKWGDITKLISVSPQLD